MKKLYSFLFLLLLLSNGVINAQQWTIAVCSGGPPSGTLSSTYGPMYSVATANATNRIAVIYPASQLTSLTGTFLTNAYFHRNTTASMAGTPNFKIYLKEVTATDWGSGSLTWANEITNATLVYNGNPAPIVGNAVGWVNFPFSTNFPYSGTQNLAVFMEYTNATASSAITWSYEYNDPCINSANSNTTKYTNNTTGTLPATLGTSNYRRPYIGFDYTYPPCVSPPTAGSAEASNAAPCFGQNITLNLIGNNFGSGQTYQWEKATSVSGPWVPEGGVQTSPPITVSPSVGTTYYRCQVTCGTSTVPSVQDTVIVPAQFPAGTYTINSAQPTGSGNFQSFTDAVNAIACGIAGPVVFNVATGSGPYIEQVTIPQIINASATNTVTFNGNGASLNYSTVLSANLRAGITLNGADHITLNGLVLNAVDSAYGWGIHLTNQADSNTISNCTINVSTSNSSAQNHHGIVISGSATTAAGSGNNGNGNLITGNTINGGYYGVAIYGSSATLNMNNVVQNNNIRDFYLYGVYTLYNSGLVVRGNDVTRPTRANTGAASGILISTGNTNNLIEKNKIHNVFDAMTSSTSAFSAIEITGDGTPGQENKIINNAIYNINNNGVIYGIQNATALYCHIYHNTIALETPASTPTGITYGFYQSGTAAGIRFVNNIVSIARDGSGAKYCIYKSTAGNVIQSDSNVYYLNNTGTGAQNIGYQSSAQATLTAWTNVSGLDANSTVADPIYTNYATGDLTPSNSLANNRGTPLGITDDIVNASRSLTTPDVGAYEFSVSGCSGTPLAGTASVAGNITNACIGGTVNLSLSGFSTDNGISIEWQESPAGAGIWTAITGATSATYSGVLTSSTDYRAKVTCANGGGFDLSNTISINSNPFYLCYCSPNTGVTLHGTTSNYITNVAIVNTGMSSPSSAAGAGGYTQQDYTISANTATLTQGQTYTLNATISNATYGAELWIDWDQNGLFDTTEYYLLTPGLTSTTSFAVPVSAVPGLTGMRIRTIASATIFYDKVGACASVTNGSETEDYVITIAQGVPCSGIPSITGTIAASNTSLCNGMTTSFSLTGFPTELGISFQWESSPSGQNNFIPIAGATGFTYTSAPLSANTDFRVAVICTNPGGGTGYTNIETITVNNPQLTSTNGGTRCGIGTVMLTATPSGSNNVNWYASATGGAPLATGTNTFTTPPLTTTTTYYATAIQGGNTVNVGRIAPVSGAGTVLSTYGQDFTITQPITLNSVDVISTTGTSITISLYNSNGATQLQTTGAVTVPTNATTTVNLNWQLVPGTYRIAANAMTGNFIRENSNVTYPIALGSVGQVNGFVSSITGSVTTSASYYWFYNWLITTGCEGTRVPVVATVTPAPAYTISASPDTICLGSSSTVSVSSANNYTYTWTPSGSGSSFSAAPSATTKYYVNGLDGNNCAIYDSVIVEVKSAPATASAVASPAAICVTGSTTVTVNPAPMYGIDIEWEKNTGSGYAVIPGATGTTYTEPVSTTTYYRAKLYCNSTLATTSDADTVVYNNPQVAQTFPGERCGAGPVTLAAIGANGATINWYANATGGTPLASGNAFTTPSIATTTSYYAAASSGASNIFTGNTTPTSIPGGSTSGGSGTTNYGIVFDVFTPFTLETVTLYPVSSSGASGTVKIDVINSSGTIVHTATVNVTGSVGGVVPQTVTLNFNMQPGTNYKIRPGNFTGVSSLTFNSSPGSSFNYGYPYTVPGVLSINTSTLTAAPTNTARNDLYYYFYDWKIAIECEGTRVPVTATINPAASGTGLATGGTTVGTSQAANTTESYTDACNDTVAVVASGSTALGTTSAIVLTSATVPTHQNKPYVPRAYDISPATDGPATVTLYALQSEFNAYNSYVTSNSLSLPLLPTGPSDLTGMGNIVITQYHGSASAGTQGPLGLYSSANVDFIQNSSITVTPVGNYWKLTFPVTGFSGFFIHTGANPLAIDLKNISAVNMGSRNRVDWTTGTEQSGDRFELERSADGTNFRKLADITAKGQPSGYSYWDETPVTGVNYYRLKLVDASGKGSYSKVVTATVKSGNFTVEAYPNPVKDVLTVKVFGVQGKDATVSITDITGKVIRIEAMSSDRTMIEMSGLAQGMYLIKYADSDHSQTIKVNKQ